MSPVFDRSGGSTGLFLHSIRGGDSSDSGLPSISMSTQKNSMGTNSIVNISGYSRTDSSDIMGSMDTSRSRPMETYRSENPYGSTDRNPTLGGGSKSSGDGSIGNSPAHFTLKSPSLKNSASDGKLSPNSPSPNSRSVVGTTLPSLNNSAHDSDRLHSSNDDGTPHHTESPHPTTSTTNPAVVNTTNHTNNITSGFVEDYSKYDDDNEYESTQFGFGVGAGKASPSSKKMTKKAGGGNSTSSTNLAGKVANRTK